MKNYSANDAEFKSEIQIPEPTDPAHADVINTPIKQLFGNTVANKRAIETTQEDVKGQLEESKTKIEERLEDFSTKIDGFDKNDVDISPDGNTISIINGDKKIITNFVSDTKIVKKLYVKDVLKKTKTTTFSDNYTKVREVIE
nr:MAG TPA: hypothetical protein [Caudoviricetes sp.]